METPFSKKQIQLILSKHFDSYKFNYIEKGVSNHTYRIQSASGTFYLTITKYKEEPLSVKSIALKLLASKGVSVPKPLVYENYSSKLSGFSYLICHEVPGKSLYESCINNPSEILKKAGEDLARAHSIKIVEGFGYIAGTNSQGELYGNEISYYQHLAERIRYKDTLKNKIHVLTNSNLITKKETESLQMYVKSNLSLLDHKRGNLIHGDFSKDHIFVHNGTYSGIIDWDGIASGSRFYDLAQFSTYYTQSELKTLISGYCSIYPLTEIEVQENILLERIIYCVGKIAKQYKGGYGNLNSETNHYSNIALNKLKDDLKLIR